MSFLATYHVEPHGALRLTIAASITARPPCFFFQAEDGIRDDLVTGVQTCALPISPGGKTATADVYVVGEIVVASSRANPPGKFQLYAVDRSNLAQLTKLTPDTTSASDPAFSPDGARLAFVSQRDGNPEIY